MYNLVGDGMMILLSLLSLGKYLKLANCGLYSFLSRSTASGQIDWGSLVRIHVQTTYHELRLRYWLIYPV
jgi:hypothetical protein